MIILFRPWSEKFFLIISFGKDAKSSSGKCQKSQSYKLVTEQVIEYLTLTMQKYEHILLKKILLVLYFVVFAWNSKFKPFSAWNALLKFNAVNCNELLIWTMN